MPVDRSPAVVGARAAPVPAHHGKAPPVPVFPGEDLETEVDDWLPALETASVWNAWTAEEKVIQVAGYLSGRALQEFNLLQLDEKGSFGTAVEALCTHLDPGSKSVAAQDFCHTAQRDAESVGDFIRRLECTFRVAYGRDAMSVETSDTVLYCQLHEGLHYELMKGPAVLGATKYQKLCVATKMKRSG